MSFYLRGGGRLAVSSKILGLAYTIHCCEFTVSYLNPVGDHLKKLPKLYAALGQWHNRLAFGTIDESQ